jgi:hypothetical protein
MSGLLFATDYAIVGCTSKLTKEEPMLRKLRNQARQAVKGRIEFDLDGFDLDISPEEVIADLNFGVGPIAETARLVQEGRPEVGRVA